MEIKKRLVISICVLTIMLAACKNMTRTQKGAAVGTAAGGAVGAVVGKTLGNTALGAIIGAGVGGVTGAVIGKKMDKQAEEIKKNAPNVKVERVGEGIVLEFSEKILFAFDSYSLSAGAMNNLNNVIT